MKNNQLAIASTPQIKYGSRTNSQLMLNCQQKIMGPYSLGEISKLKQYHQLRKNKNNLMIKNSFEQKLNLAESGNLKIYKKKSIQSPRQFYQGFSQDPESHHGYQIVAKDGIKNTNKYSVKQGPYEMPQKYQISPTKARKESIYSNIQYGSQQKLRINSPRLKERLEPSSKICSTQKGTAHLEQIKLLKGSKYLDGQRVQQNGIKYFKELKQTVSTNSTNKLKPVKIQDFQLGRDLGKGKFGSVKIARHKKTGLLFSIKIINKIMIKQDKIMDQLIKQTKIQSFLNHSHIVKLYSVFDDKQNVYLLMELCPQGNLYDYMQKLGKIPEQQASQYMKQTCQAVSQLHFHKIIHRDIKPQNIVLSFGMIKICDFGWSTQIKGTMRDTFCGSPLYISPQLLKGQLYDQKVDLWALGILGYEMMTGTIPFEIITERDLSKIITSRIVYPSWMSPVTISFLQQLLQKNPQNRTSVQELMDHPFITKRK